MKNDLLEKVKEQYKKKAAISILRERDWEVISERYAKEFAKAELEKNKFDATELWNKATKFESPLQTNGYWKALSDLERLGVIKMSEIEE